MSWWKPGKRKPLEQPGKNDTLHVQHQWFTSNSKPWRPEDRGVAPVKNVGEPRLLFFRKSLQDRGDIKRFSDRRKWRKCVVSHPSAQRMLNQVLQVGGEWCQMETSHREKMKGVKNVKRKHRGPSRGGFSFRNPMFVVSSPFSLLFPLKTFVSLPYLSICFWKTFLAFSFSQPESGFVNWFWVFLIRTHFNPPQALLSPPLNPARLPYTFISHY